MMKRMEEKETGGEEPDLCGTQYTAPPPRLCSWGLQPDRFRSTYGIPRVLRMQHLRLGRKGGRMWLAFCTSFITSASGLICV